MKQSQEPELKSFKQEFVVADDTGLLKRVILEARRGKESIIDKLEQKEKAPKGLKGKEQPKEEKKEEEWP